MDVASKSAESISSLYISHSVVPNTSLCVSCSTVGSRKYLILSKSGSVGSAFENCCKFYETNLQCKENFGSYVCHQCKWYVREKLSCDSVVQLLQTPKLIEFLIPVIIGGVLAVTSGYPNAHSSQIAPAF